MKIFKICLLLALLSGTIFGFGQNKVVYQTFDWKTYETPHFTIYYYPEGEASLRDVVYYAESSYKRLSEFFQHEIKFRIPLIYYQTHAEFQSTHITLSLIGEGVGAFAEPFRDRMVIPADSPPEELRAVIAHELTHIFQFSIFFDHQIARAMASRIPFWVYEGLASYLADDESNIDRMILRDAVLSDRVPSLAALDMPSFIAYRFGHAIFDFIEEKYGEQAVKDFVFEFRKDVKVPLKKVVKEVFKEELEDFESSFHRYLKLRYMPEYISREEARAYGSEIRYKKDKRTHIFSPSASPSGEIIAALTTKKDRVDVALYSVKTGKELKILTRGYTGRYEYIVAESLLGATDLAWSPDGDRIAFFGRKGKNRNLYVISALNGKIKATYSMGGIQTAASPAYSPDGRWMAFSGMKDGRSDIFRLSLETGAIDNLTQDELYDCTPIWLSNDEIVYVSNLGRERKIMRLDIAQNSQKEQLTFGESSDIQPSLSRDGKTLYFASDREGSVYNLYSLDLETFTIGQLTNVFSGAFQPIALEKGEFGETLAFSSFREGRFRLWTAKAPLLAITEEKLEEPSPVDAQKVAESIFPERYEILITEGAKGKYKPEFSVDGGGVSAGVASDGTVLSDTYFTVSDMLGDHRFVVNLQTAREFAQSYLAYVNYRRRVNWGVVALDARDYYYLYRGEDFDKLTRYRQTGAGIFCAYPFNRFYRVELTGGYFSRALEVPQTFVDPATGAILAAFRVRAEHDYPIVGIAFAGDTAQARHWGATRGHRFRFAIEYAPDVGSVKYKAEELYNSGGFSVLLPDGDDAGFVNIILDARNYLRITRRSVWAMRVFGAMSEGGVQSVFYIGGVNTIRGIDYRALAGDRAFFMNQELRFPLVDALVFPGGWGFGEVRGVIFWDIGAAYFEGEPFDFYDSKENRLKDGVSSVGAGFSVMLGLIELQWDFAFGTNLSTIDKDAKMSFWIGRSF